MKHYRNILVAVDFSDMGELVVEQAKAIAVIDQARLTLLHVVQDIPPSVDAFGDTSSLIINTEVEHELLKNAKEHLPILAQQYGLPIDSVQVEMGMDITDTILQVADTAHSDLIVIGHSGKKGFLGLLGSTATAVVKAAHCDVLVVRR